jgi:hypothetical protein
VEVRAEEREGPKGIRLVMRRTLAGAFGRDSESGAPSAFSKIGVNCQGHNPALAIGPSTAGTTSCGEDLHPLLRGASNLYFPQVVSSIYIPDIDDRELAQDVLDLLDDQQMKTTLLVSAQNADNGLVSVKAAKNALKDLRPELSIEPKVLADAANRHLLVEVLLGDRKTQAFLRQKIKIAADRLPTRDMVAAAIASFCPDWDIDPSHLLPALTEKFSRSEGALEIMETTEARQDTLVESEYRRDEYRVFCRDIQEGFPKSNLLIRSFPASKYASVITEHFDRISLMHKLRETRAFVGFSRIFPESEVTQDERWRLIAGGKKRWLPAVIVRGEGIFFKFREDKISAWLQKFGAHHVKRLSAINKSFGERRASRRQPPRVITPKHVLIHSFAHLLINQLVYECGYGSSSLKERIYSSDGPDPMSGVLVYTAAGDSEGTMGGLVKMGEPLHLEQVVLNALEGARWCSSDPVCIETEGQGPDNSNLGACHSCTLLPETSCEEQNRLLDRGVVIGTLTLGDDGFFSARSR